MKGQNQMQKKFYSLLPILALLALAGCGTLDKTGAYNGDKALYDADTTLTLSYDTIHQFVTWEYQNRAALAGTPAVKQFADKLRTEAPQAFASAIALRDAYKGNPTTESRTALQTVIAVLREMMTQATIYYARAPGAVSPIKAQ